MKGPRHKKRVKRRGKGRGSLAKGRRGSSRPVVAVTAGIVALALIVGLGAVLMAGRSSVKASSPVPAPVSDEPAASVTVVSTALTANAQAVSFAGSLQDYFTELAKSKSTARLVVIDGNGVLVHDEVRELTPRLENGDEVKVAKRAEPIIAATVAGLSDTINQVATQPGEALLLGLSSLQVTTEQLIIVSPGLDLADPLNFEALGWDVPVEDILASLDGELPDLSAVTTVTFVVPPVAGAQHQLREPQRAYLEKVWTAVLKKAGAQQVNFVYPEGTAPPAGAPASPPVTVPPPPDTPVPATPQKCVIDSGTYFRSDHAVLIDRKATKRALQGCADQIGADSTAVVVGHTAGKDPDNQFALGLSRKRAHVIAGLLTDLGVPGEHITEKGLGNRNQPYASPFDRRNRSVVVIINPKESPA